MGLHACIAARASLDQLSRERVRMEMLKLLIARHAAPVLAVMAESGLLGPILGGVADLSGFREHPREDRGRRCGLAPIRCAGSAHFGACIVEDAERLWRPGSGCPMPSTIASSP